MPYVKGKVRAVLRAGTSPRNAGELNYSITALLLQYLKDCGESYQTHNDIMGVLDSAGKEWYRRKVVPYEERKRVDNGDVYW